ncbi:hypothetical protein PV04_05865 [Phialophora macrospora]|uniref:Uncharacterized protein n=1 Tax=Phialophora macrospora TaxID=1851006 RepID=A0A0D2CMZ1_9EURO|nr:hypothetical protein PV04_05865 [Phialophora macrospora]
MSKVSHKCGPNGQEQDLAGKVAVITGITKGIGRAIAVNLAARGCHILGTCTSTRSRPLIDSLRMEIKTLYQDLDHEAPPIEDVILSLTDSNASQAIADALLETFQGRVDIFVNNAAVVDRTPVGGLEAARVANMCLGNIQTPAMIIDELVQRRYFRPNSRIIFISSAESTRCAPEALMYATTKAANEAMARCYANAFGGRHAEFEFMAGTTANSLLTGLADTPGPQQFGQKAFEEFKDYWIPRQAIPRFASPEDIADVVGLLCSREARWITGSKVSANGGSIAIL